MKVYVEAYGCTLNRGEAGEFTEAAAGAGHVPVTGPDEAEALAVFTCGVIGATERQMLKRLRELSAMPGKVLMVLGCLGDISPDAVREAAPSARVYHASDWHLALEQMGQSPGRANSEFWPSAAMQEQKAVGIIPIAQGCLGHCTYCITRKARGELQSRPVGEIAGRLETLAARGMVEIQLCAQDTGAYGADTGTDLASLLQVLSSRPGEFMLRVGMMNPSSIRGMVDRLLDAFDGGKVFRFLHLPVQSGSQGILDAMGREHSVGEFRQIVAAFRRRFPDMVLSTDIIVGFPGETEEDFSMTLELVDTVKPDVMNITRFSPRPGTPAISMRPRVPGWVAKERSRLLTGLRFEITAQIQDRFIGRRLRALATERRQPGTTFLRTRDYRPVVISELVPLGRWYDVDITGAAKTHLEGVLASS